QGSLQRLRLLRAGDDGLDLMGGELSVSDAVVVGAAGNAVSAGEEVELALGSSLLASARTGLRVKNGARVTCSGSLVFEAETGLAVEGPTPYYPLLPRLLADDLGLVAVKEESHLSRRVARRVELSRVFRTLSDAGGLARLRREVLGLADWGGLEALVQGWRARVTP
ncbi:MAG TPA: hypothetical protein P5076_24925, partial [Myxococcota bacterium]|nr:hypothetical protein [Myxococcota bacterium]